MKYSISLILFSAILLFSCGSEPSGNVDETDNSVENLQIEEELSESVIIEEPIILTKNGITLVGHMNAISYDDASLELFTPTNSALDESGDIDFEFLVNNYELSSQTKDDIAGQCANSAKGQHIHFIMDNEPYSAHYAPNMTVNMTEGHHVMLAFLSRSYHMSLKNEQAYVLKQFNLSGGPNEAGFDELAPHMFYSRPKGEYIGKDAERVMLDFFLVNADLAEDGNYVKATVNGTEFEIRQWIPYFMEGLPMGDNTIRLELVNAEGQTINSPYNPVERTIILSPES